VSEVPICGAAGYAGRIRAAEFVEAGLRPVLGGRPDALRISTHSVCPGRDVAVMRRRLLWLH